MPYQVTESMIQKICPEGIPPRATHPHAHDLVCSAIFAQLKATLDERALRDASLLAGGLPADLWLWLQRGAPAGDRSLARREMARG